MMAAKRISCINTLGFKTIDQSLECLKPMFGPEHGEQCFLFLDLRF